MTTPMKLIIAILAILLLGAGFYMFDWSDKWARRKTAEDQLSAKRQELATLEEAIKELPKLQAQVREKQAELDKVVRSRVTSENADEFVANYLREVERLVSDQQKATSDYTFVIKSVSPGAQAESKGGGKEASAGPEQPEALSAFQTRVFSMSMEGRYATLVDFLYQLGAMKLDRLVTINSIRLSRGGKGEGAGAPTLTIDLPITAYLKTGTN